MKVRKNQENQIRQSHKLSQLLKLSLLFTLKLFSLPIVFVPRFPTFLFFFVQIGKQNNWESFSLLLLDEIDIQNNARKEWNGKRNLRNVFVHFCSIYRWNRCAFYKLKHFHLIFSLCWILLSHMLHVNLCSNDQKFNLFLCYVCISLGLCLT